MHTLTTLCYRLIYVHKKVKCRFASRNYNAQHKKIVYCLAIANSPLAARTKGVFFIPRFASSSFQQVQLIVLCGADCSSSALFHFPGGAASGRQT